MSSSDEEKTVGCILCMWSLLVTTPMWLILLFAIMSVNEMPTWAWVLYWIYIPCTVMGVVTATIGKMLVDLSSRRMDRGV